ncbi:MAG: hypothetical protein HYW26_02135 [Candidatus Aenigmarchaeota archaeon]|nr:hypothetical protein [Candidatus Aenigmarchaeota archaeon]
MVFITTPERPVSASEDGKEFTWLSFHDAFLRDAFPGYWVGIKANGSRMYVAISKDLSKIYRMCETMGIRHPATYRIPMSLSADGLVHMEL